MTANIRERIIALLRELRCHPEFNAEMVAKSQPLWQQLVDEHQGEEIDLKTLLRDGHPVAREYWRNAYDALLMDRNHFAARVKFLERVVHYVQSREGRQEVLDDGCGSGIDLYCLSRILGDKVRLVGIDLNEASIELAQARNPGVTILSEPDGTQFDFIYSDFYALMEETPAAHQVKIMQYVNGLKEGGHVLQNSDFSGQSEHIFSTMMVEHFILIRKELLALIPGGPGCYFYDWIKKSAVPEGQQG